MADGTLTVAQVETEAALRITALDASAYNQGTDTKTITATWAEFRSFSQRGVGPASVAHLGFSANVESSPNSGTERDGAREHARLRSRLVVAFSYRLRGDAEIADSRLARDAAHDVIVAINKPTSEWNCEIIDAGRPLFAADSSFLVVSVLFDILHEIEV